MNREIGEKQGDMGRPHGKDKYDKLVKRVEERWKNIKDARKGEANS